MILTATEEIRMSSRHFDPSDFGNVTGQGQFQFTRCQIPNLDASENILLMMSITDYGFNFFQSPGSSLLV